MEYMKSKSCQLKNWRKESFFGCMLFFLFVMIYAYKGYQKKEHCKYGETIKYIYIY